MKKYSILLAMTVALNANAQIINDVVVVDGNKIEIQKMTLECPLWYFDFVDGTYYHDRKDKWIKKNRKITLHIMNTKKLSGSYSPRPEAHGWYWWNTNKWHNFDDITENTIWIDRLNENEWIQDYSYNEKLRIEVYFEKRWIGITRNTLELVQDYGQLNIIQHKYKMRTWLQHKFIGDDADIKRFGPPEIKTKCQILKYEEPPARIGF